MSEPHHKVKPERRLRLGFRQGLRQRFRSRRWLRRHPRCNRETRHRSRSLSGLHARRRHRQAWRRAPAIAPRGHRRGRRWLRRNRLRGRSSVGDFFVGLGRRGSVDRCSRRVDGAIAALGGVAVGGASVARARHGLEARTRRARGHDGRSRHAAQRSRHETIAPREDRFAIFLVSRFERGALFRIVHVGVRQHREATAYGRPRNGATAPVAHDERDTLRRRRDEEPRRPSRGGP